MFPTDVLCSQIYSVSFTNSETIMVNHATCEQLPRQALHTDSSVEVVVTAPASCLTVITAPDHTASRPLTVSQQ